MYIRLPAAAGAIKGIPNRVALARNVNRVAVSLNVSSGVPPVQVFEMTKNGLVEIPINGLRSSSQYAVTISPNGRWLVTGLFFTNTAGMTVYEYDGVGSYNFKKTYPSFATYRIDDFEWFSEDVVLCAQSAFTNKNLGGYRLDDISVAGELILSSQYSLNYGFTDVLRTDNNRNAIFGASNGGGNSAIRTAVYNESTRRLALTTTSQYLFGGNRIAVRKDGSRIISSRNPASGGLGTAVLFASGSDAAYTISSTQYQDGINTNYCTVLHVTDSLVMMNEPNGSFKFYAYQPDNNLAPIATPLDMTEVSAIGKQLTWAKNTNYNGGYMAGIDNSTADLWVYQPLKDYDANIVTNIKPITTTGTVQVQSTARISTTLNSFTTQIISGDDESSYTFNLKLMPAFLRGKSNIASQFEFVPFGTQYAHGKTQIPSITSKGFVGIDLEVMETETVIPSIEPEGLFALPPQFEGDTVISEFVSTGTLRGQDFATGDVVLPVEFEIVGKIASGEEAEGDVRIEQISSDGFVKPDLGASIDAIIPPVLNDGLVEPDTAVYGDVIIPNEFSFGGYVNVPWTIETDTLIPNEFTFGGFVNNPALANLETDIPSIETSSFISNGEEGVVINAYFGSILTDANLDTIEPEQLLGDVLIEIFETGGFVAPEETINSDTVINIVEMIESESSLVMSNQFDSVIVISDIEVDGYVEMITGTDIKVELQKITLNAIAELLKRKRHINIV